VDAADPAAWPALAYLQFFNRSFDMVFSGRLLLDGNIPANPLIARQWRKAFPYSSRTGSGIKSFL
jgi:hypothetical protein